MNANRPLKIRHLTVVFDSRCGFCIRCARWLQAQSKYIPIDTIASNSPEVKRLYPQLESRCSNELCAVDDRGGVYTGNDAWIICLYCLKEYRLWSQRLTNPLLRPWARTIYDLVSQNRRGISKLLFGMRDQALVSQLSSSGERDYC